MYSSYGSEFAEIQQKRLQEETRRHRLAGCLKKRRRADKTPRPTQPRTPGAAQCSMDIG